jgi:hypothetical protein
MMQFDAASNTCECFEGKFKTKTASSETYCDSCNPNCRSCRGDFSTCTACHGNSKSYLHDGKCLDACPTGYVSDDANIC